MKKMVAFLLMLVFTLTGCITITTSNIDEASNQTRSFLMGFGTWYPDSTPSGMQQTRDFLEDRADIVRLFVDKGVPWEAMADNDDLPDYVVETLEREKANVPKGSKVFLDISATNIGHTQITDWSKNGLKTPVSSPWDSYTLADEEVTKAYVHFVKKVIEYLDADYVSFGIEVNDILKNEPENWEMYKEFHSYVYTELKKEYPNIPTFASFVYKIDFVPVEDLQWVQENNDILSLSTYPHLHGTAVSDQYFDGILPLNMSIAVSETGLPSKTFTTLGVNFVYTQKDQQEFIEMLLTEAQEHDFEFVVQFTNVDYTKLLSTFPPGYIRDSAEIWAYTGLYDENNIPKLAAATWDEWFARAYEE